MPRTVRVERQGSRPTSSTRSASRPCGPPRAPAGTAAAPWPPGGPRDPRPSRLRSRSRTRSRTIRRSPMRRKPGPQARDRRVVPPGLVALPCLDWLWEAADHAPILVVAADGPRWALDVERHRPGCPLGLVGETDVVPRHPARVLAGRHPARHLHRQLVGAEGPYGSPPTVATFAPTLRARHPDDRCTDLRRSDPRSPPTRSSRSPMSDHRALCPKRAGTSRPRPGTGLCAALPRVGVVPRNRGFRRHERRRRRPP
jgi:hypothetical protein